MAEDALYKILVVDDEPDVEPLVQMRMRKEVRSGLYDFVFARNGVEALKVLEEEADVDMVLSDINMPEMDGLTLLDQIAEANPDMRSVIISAYGDMKNIRTAMNRGAFDFIIKPIDFDDFRVTISRGLAQIAKWREALASRDKLVTLQHELKVAKNVQQSIMPTSLPETDAYQLSGAMEAAREVGGDFYHVERFEDGKIAIIIADVSDKGVPAAFFMVLSRTLLKGALRDDPSPGVVLKAVNDLLHEDNEAQMFVTTFYGIYNPEDGSLVYANGGHNPPLLARANGESELLPMTNGVALGLVPDLDYAEASAELAPGDSVVLYTDGVTEAENSDSEEFGMDRFREVVAANGGTDAVKLNDAVVSAVHEFAGDAPQFDDITSLTLHRKSG